MELGTKIALGVGGTVLGVGGAIWIRQRYLDSLPDDDPAAAGMIGDSFGDMRVPADEPVAVSAIIQPTRMRVRSSVAPTGRAVAAGVLGVRIKTPKCRILYDSHHYAGSRLKALWDHGDQLSLNKANAIMEWFVWDGPATRVKLHSGYYAGQMPETGSFYYKNLGTDETTAKYNEIWGQVASGVVGGNSLQDEWLEGKGYTYVPANKNTTVKMELPPGYYQVIADYVNPREQAFSAWSAYWVWDKDGPRQKHCKTWFERLKEHQCNDKVTRFKRWLLPSSWSRISRLVKVGVDEETDLSFTPELSLKISNRHTLKNGYSRGMATICVGSQIMSLISRALTKKDYVALLYRLAGYGCSGMR